MLVKGAIGHFYVFYSTNIWVYIFVVQDKSIMPVFAI
jgi:hypothetical protein